MEVSYTLKNGSHVTKDLTKEELRDEVLDLVLSNYSVTFNSTVEVEGVLTIEVS